MKAIFPPDCSDAAWLVPELPLDRAGRKRTRLERNCGIMVVETHADQDEKGSNKLTYCLVSCPCPLVTLARPCQLPPSASMDPPPAVHRKLRSSTSTSRSDSTPSPSNSSTVRRLRPAHEGRQSPLSTTS